MPTSSTMHGGAGTDVKKETKGPKKQNRRRRQKDASNKKKSTCQQKSKDCKPLSVNEDTRWKRNRNHDTESAAERDARLVRWLLNKVTPSNFDKVVMVFVAETTIHQSEERARDAILAMINRASIDPRYTSVYAELCGRLAVDLSDTHLATECDDTTTTPEKELESSVSNNPLSDLVSFRATLRKICMEEIHRSSQIAPVLKSEAAHFARRRFVGGKRFLGELYNHNIIPTNDMIQYLELLMEKTVAKERSEEKTTVDELGLEGICVLLDTSGKLLDESNLTMTSSQVDELQRCWDFLTSLVLNRSKPNQPKLSFRIRSMILDLLELRQLKWHPVRFGARQRRDLVPRALFVDSTHIVAKDIGTKGTKKKEVHFGNKTGASVRT